jgi:hypothetical protein
MYQNEIRMKWFIDESFDEDNNPEVFPLQRYYDVHLFQPADLFLDKETSSIKYIHSEWIATERELSNFEVTLLGKAITSVKIPFWGDVAESFTSHPYDNYRVIIETYNFNLEFRWSSNDALSDPKRYKSLMKLVDLVSKIEPIDYKALGIEHPEIKE